ncbi:MAG: hypothetical protein ABUL72_04640, partial [Armatimonadota bacterium]
AILMKRRHMRSRRGDHALEALRGTYAHFSTVGRHEGAAASDLALGVALFGLGAAVGSPAYSDMRALRPQDNGFTSSSSCGSSCGSSSTSASSDSGGGSSCGGGGGGGGGCGGG